MNESNGSRRLDRIEALLEKTAERLDKVATMGYLHDERQARMEAKFEEMQEDEATYRAEQRAREKRMDERIDKLVSSIGDLIVRIPPTAFSR